MSSPQLAQLLPAELFPEGFARNLRTGRDLMIARRRAPEDEYLTTNCEPLDRLLQGGLRRGRLTELVSWGSSGRFSMVLGALSATTRSGEAAALIDLGDALSPSSADAAGVDLERLLWVRPHNIKEALLATEAVIACGMPLVILDLGVPPVPGGRGVEAFWLRLTRSAQSRRSAVLVTSPYRVTGTAAHVVVEVKDRRAVWHGSGLQPRLLAQLSNRVQLAKGPGRQRARAETLAFRPQSAVADASSIGIGDKTSTLSPLEKMRVQLAEAAKTKTSQAGASPKGRSKAAAMSTKPPPDPLMARPRAHPQKRAIA